MTIVTSSSLAKGFQSTPNAHKPMADLITKILWQASFYDWLQLQVADPIALFKTGAHK